MKCEVDDARVFYQIVRERRNPLAVLREAISNASDACADRVEIEVSANKEGGVDLLITDNGFGMKKKDFRRFFGLAFSNKRDGAAIGSKGLGTKLFFNSTRVEVATKNRLGGFYSAVLEHPLDALKSGEVPTYRFHRSEGRSMSHSGTQIRIVNLNVSSRSSYLSGGMLESYIKWYTAAGNCRRLFEYEQGGLQAKLRRNLADGSREEFEVDGHELPLENSGGNVAPEDFAYIFDPFSFELPINDHHGSVEVEIAGAICGSDAHVVTDKRMKKQYKGLFLAKDYFAVKNVSDEVFRGTGEWQNFHVIVNCQALELTMNREGFVDTSQGPLLMRIIQALREFANSVRKGERFRFQGKTLELTSNYAGRGYGRLKRLRERDQRLRSESSTLLGMVSLGASERLEEFSGGGGPLLEPRGPRGVLLIFQTILTLASLKKAKIAGTRFSRYRILAPLENEDLDVLLQCASEEGEWSNPRCYRVEYDMSAKSISRLPDGIAGVICWKLEGSPSESALRSLADGVEEIRDVIALDGYFQCLKRTQ